VLEGPHLWFGFKNSLVHSVVLTPLFSHGTQLDGARSKSLIAASLKRPDARRMEFIGNAIGPTFVRRNPGVGMTIRFNFSMGPITVEALD
jgi:hypothetical protein